MTTINHECYVSLEVAKLLKEAGFDWEVMSFYTNDITEGCESEYELRLVKFDNWNGKNKTWCDLVSAPTLEVVQRWLREVKGIYVESVLCANRGTSGHSFGFSIAEVSADLSTVKILYPSTYFDEEETKGFMKYEVSLEAGIKKALEIILEKGE